VFYDLPLPIRREKQWQNPRTRNSKRGWPSWKSGRRGGALEFRVGEKGGVSVYGLGRFPVTLYYEQWARLLDAAGDLRTFLEENKAEGKLKLKEK
jgi:hypothetical protein